MITIACRNCGTNIETYPSQRKRKKFCSRKCYAADLSKRQRGAAHPMYGKKHSPESLAKMAANRRANARRGPDSPNWKGSWRSRGYVMISQPNGRGRPEHRIVMEKILGRPLLPSEAVHHRNGIKHDNRPENLEALTNSTHKMEHKEILRELRALRYENERLRSLLATYLPAGVTTSAILAA